MYLFCFSLLYTGFIFVYRYILNYLRDGGVTADSLPRDRQVLRELRNEAVYFQLNGLVQTIEKFL